MTTYRQIAHRLRLAMGPGRPDIVSERPRHKRTGTYQDLDEQGQSTTLVEIPSDTLADVPALLGAGAIQELPPSPAPAEAGGKPSKGGGRASG